MPFSKEHIDLNNLPNHIAVIMDGNGRWAKKKGAMRIFGHRNPGTGLQEEALWELHGYTPRVPAKAGAAAEDGTPGVHGLRTLVLRAESRLRWFEFADTSKTRGRWLVNEEQSTISPWRVTVIKASLASSAR